MTGREQRIQEEVTALWRELFGEPPPIQADGGMMLDAILRGVPTKDYERLRSPYLRPTNITGPTTP